MGDISHTMTNHTVDQTPRLDVWNYLALFEKPLLCGECMSPSSNPVSPTDLCYPQGGIITHQDTASKEILKIQAKLKAAF